MRNLITLFEHQGDSNTESLGKGCLLLLVIKLLRLDLYRKIEDYKVTKRMKIVYVPSGNRLKLKRDRNGILWESNKERCDWKVVKEYWL